MRNVHLLGRMLRGMGEARHNENPQGRAGVEAMNPHMLQWNIRDPFLVQWAKLIIWYLPLWGPVVLIIALALVLRRRKRKTDKDKKAVFHIISDMHIGHNSSIKESAILNGVRVLVICPYCGAKTEQGITNCRNCGANL